MKKNKNQNPHGRITKAELARRLHVSRSLVDYHLNKPDAPKPDASRRYDPATEDWVRQALSWASGATSAKERSLKRRKLEIEVQELEHLSALRRGELVNKKAVADKITSLGTEIFAMMKERFVDELPGKYPGKNEVECRFLNEEAFNKIAVDFRSGVSRLRGE